ncbi:hypothetical protein DID80_01165 [Candidatus Marinamargulisbacteria bacterium SCGC AAA071-K20]|nr:hypothetical protein DID80_01165 [Candidatus Marinamargulisbacteria bacterium SCGC AAA071-K20]
MILFYTTGSKKNGLGHLSRTISLIKEVLSRNIPYHCLVNNDTTATSLLSKQEIRFSIFKSIETLKDLSPSLIVFDTKQDVAELIKEAKKNKIKTIIIDSLDNNRLNADLVIYPNPHFNFNELDWAKAKGARCGGSEYTIIKPSFIKERIKDNLKLNRHRIVISMGGSDPNKLTELVMDAIAKTNYEDIDVVAGPAFNGLNDIKKLAKKYPKFTVHDNVSDLSTLFSEAGCVITGLGISIYEAAILKVPVIVISNYESDQNDEEALDNFNGIFPLGFYKQVEPDDITDSLHAIFDSIQSHQELADDVGQIVDTKGVSRIVDLF